MICVLQFDAASVAVVERMLAAGRLPVLAGLIARGRQMTLQTPADHFAAGAFHTLYSGIELADHGLFYPFQWDARSQRARYMTAFPAPPAIWERLARVGRRTLALDPYESRPPQDWLGTYVCGWGFRDRVVLPRWALPRAAGAHLAGVHGKGPHATEIFGRPTVRELLALRTKLVAAPGRVADAAVELLGRESYDLAWLTFSAAHLAGHQFWDLSQLAQEPEGRDRELLQGALEDVYAEVDAAFGRVLDALPGDCDVIVASAVGMDVNSSRADLLPQMLEAVLRGGPLPPDADGGGPGAIWRLRAAIPPGARGAIAQALPDRVALELTARLELRGIDWSQTAAFCHPADNQGYIRLNLRGRERDGIVDPGEAGALLRTIAEGLATFRDPDGAPAVASVDRVAEHHAGERAGQLPDLVVQWSERPATTLAGVHSPSLGDVLRRGTGSGRSGNHTPGDAWAVVVPGVHGARAPDRPPRLADVASTVAAACGVDGAGLAGESLLGEG
ncbi:MAG TPA: alkaline phosphatase family protein [Solirubrobacteraceae bacterium]|nr:alkaline phosphatase family protein [Solirubrobacteraceae bacterium]